MNRIPAEVAFAIFEHITGPIAENPHRLGKPLDEPLYGLWSARRGEYRIIYAIDKDESTITVVAVRHRRDAYRPQGA
jgi:mRNA interferase RelE/StbE